MFHDTATATYTIQAKFGITEKYLFHPFQLTGVFMQKIPD